MRLNTVEGFAIGLVSGAALAMVLGQWQHDRVDEPSAETSEPRCKPAPSNSPSSTECPRCPRCPDEVALDDPSSAGSDDLVVAVREQQGLIDALLADPPVPTAPFEPLDDAERDLMIATCDLRIESPGKLRGPVDRMVTDEEREAYDRALAEVRASTRRELDDLLARYSVDSPLGLPGVEQADEARARVARKRLGAPVEGEPTPFEISVDIEVSIGDRLERRLGEFVGAERARELRRANGGWPGGRTRYRGCPEDE